MTSTWRVSRVDKGAVRLVPDGAASVPADGTVVVGTERDGTLPMTVGEPVAPAVGDRVVLDGGRALVMPRSSELVRDTVGTTSLVQVIAANVDVVLVVEHLEPEPALGRIERMLTIAWRSDAVPVVVLTKVDLVDDADRWLDATRAVAPGVEVLAISAATGAGLEALAATLQQARTLVLVGPSGAGKSTIAALLSRLRDPEAGCVRIDGHDLRDLTIESVRQQVAVVLQESVLFATTIAENIRYGRPDASQAEIEEAARLAGAHDFVLDLPQGYDSVVGERGATLSGGQRQRIAIARAAIRNSSIIVLDEALTGLDDGTEREVVDALGRLTAGRTTVSITHDLQAAREVDRIIWIDGGRVVDDGSPDAVLARRAPAEVSGG